MGEDIQKEGSTPMSKQDEYRQEAVASLKRAEATSNQSAKMRMLLMADAWFKLAERIARSPQEFSGSEDPLVTQVFGGTQVVHP